MTTYDIYTKGNIKIIICGGENIEWSNRKRRY